MATQTLYLKDAAAGVFRALQVDGSAPATATTGTGWIVGTTAPTEYSQMASNVERAESTFTSTAVPTDAGPDATLGDGFRSENVINGHWEAGSWTIAVPVIAVTAGGAMDGRVRVRLWRSPNADGSAATEITSAAETGTAVTNLTTAQQISTVTVTLGEFGLVDEYLFLTVAWEITGAGGGATHDCLIRVGSAAAITTTEWTTATLTAYNAVLAGRGLLIAKGNYVQNLAQQFASVSAASSGTRLGELVSTVPSWSGGSGYATYDADNPTRYYRGYGIDAHSTPGKAQAGPALTASNSTAVNALRVLGTYNSQLYAGAASGQVYRQTALDTWSNPGTLTAGVPVTAIAEAANTINSISPRLWIANGSNANLASYDGTTFTNAAANATAGSNILSYITQLLSWVPSNGNTTYAFVIGGKRSASNAAYMASAQPGSWAAEWSSTGHTATVGYPEPTAALVRTGGEYCYWAASDTSALVCQLIKSAADLASPSQPQFRGAQTILGYLTDDYITKIVEIGGQIYMLGRVGRLYWLDESDADNPVMTVLAEDICPSGNQLYGAQFWDSALWIACRSSTSLLVRRFGPATVGAPIADWGWSDPIYGGTIDASATAARQLAAFGGSLYAATEAAGASKVYRMAAGVYNTTAVTLQTGEIVFDSAVIVKSVRVEHSALVASDSVQLKYARNGSSTFNSLGTNSTVGSTSTSYSAANAGRTTRLSVQAVITPGSSAATPQLGALVVTVRPVGDATREWTITLHAYGTATKPDKRVDGTSEPHTGQEIVDSLWTIYEESREQRFRDLDGDIYSVVIEDAEHVPQEDLVHAENLRWRAKLKLREV